MIPRVKNFIEYLSTKNVKLVLPTPIITEILVPVDNASDRKKFLNAAYKLFRIAPFDDYAAMVAGEIWNSNKNWKQYYDVDGDGLRNKFKYDLMIVAIAKVQKVSVLYSHDEGLRNVANANGVRAIDIPDAKPQGKQGELVFSDDGLPPETADLPQSSEPGLSEAAEPTP